MELIIIAAIGKNFELGCRGDLCWRLPEDLKFFQDQTRGQHCVAGERTFQGLPQKLIDNRKFHVISYEGMQVPEFIELAKTIDEPIWVCGGGMIYRELLPYATHMVLTQIDATKPDADVFFPPFDKSKWDITRTEDFSHEGLNYKRIWYKRKEG